MKLSYLTGAAVIIAMGLIYYMLFEYCSPNDIGKFCEMMR